MVRIVAVEADANMAVGVGGPVQIRYKTFDVECPELEAFLKARPNNQYREVHICGVEAL